MPHQLMIDCQQIAALQLYHGCDVGQLDLFAGAAKTCMYAGRASPVLMLPAVYRLAKPMRSDPRQWQAAGSDQVQFHGACQPHTCVLQHVHVAIQCLSMLACHPAPMP